MKVIHNLFVGAKNTTSTEYKPTALAYIYTDEIPTLDLIEFRTNILTGSQGIGAVYPAISNTLSTNHGFYANHISQCHIGLFPVSSDSSIIHYISKVNIYHCTIGLLQAT